MMILASSWRVLVRVLESYEFGSRKKKKARWKYEKRIRREKGKYEKEGENKEIRKMMGN